MSVFTPLPRFVTGDDHSSLIRRLIRPTTSSDVQRIDLITTSNMRLSLIDSGLHPCTYQAEGDTLIHILWQAHEAKAHIVVAGEHMPIAPGDSIAIPSGDEWRLSPDQLAILLVRHASRLPRPIGPTHGTERFSGYNRATDIALLPATTLTRWKLTGPLTIPTSKRDMVMMSLFGDMAIQYPAGVTMLAQGHASVIRPEVGPITLVPNGLAYVLVID